VGQREKLERLCRYVSRPPVASERLALTASGQVRYTLKTPYRDGTTHIVLEPLDLMARLESCARCGGKLKIIASIEEPQLIAKIRSHLERAAPEQNQSELARRARGPPVQSSLL
jgi:hypothetical protein